MINVHRNRHIDAPPEAVFAALADPKHLSDIMPRLRKVEMVERGADHARVATRLALGPLGEIRSEGDDRWQPGREVVFSTRRPVPVVARWTLTPSGEGTNVQASLSLDLGPIMGPLAAFVPQSEVASMVGPDLDAALAAIAGRVEGGGSVLS
jgi:carbon monoxide dehydrogenase subunit G